MEIFGAMIADILLLGFEKVLFLEASIKCTILDLLIFNQKMNIMYTATILFLTRIIHFNTNRNLVPLVFLLAQRHLTRTSNLFDDIFEVTS